MYNDNKEVFSCPAVSGAANRACYSIPSGDWSVVAINDRNETTTVHENPLTFA